MSNATPLRGGTDGDAIKWLYLAAAAVGPLGLAFLAPSLALRVVRVSFVASCCVGVWWVRDTWSAVPAPHSDREGIEGISPGGAVWRFVVPFYGLYWSFRAHVALCRAMNISLDRLRMPMRAHSALAIAAMIATTLALRGMRLGLVTSSAGMVALTWLAYGLWFGYMVQVDAARRIMILALRAERATMEEKRASLPARS